MIYYERMLGQRQERCRHLHANPRDAVLCLMRQPIGERRRQGRHWDRAARAISVTTDESGTEIVRTLADSVVVWDHLAIKPGLAYLQHCWTGAKVGIPDTRYPLRYPLHVGAWDGLSLLGVGAVLDAGIDPDTRTANGDTPLHMAAVMGDIGIGKVLLSRRARILKNKQGYTPGDVAKKWGHFEFARLIERHRGWNPGVPEESMGSEDPPWM